MDNSKDLYFYSTFGEVKPPKDEILAVMVAKDEPSPKEIAQFIIWEYFYSNPFYSFQEIVKVNELQKKIPSKIWVNVADYLAMFIALCEFNKYMELQFIAVCSTGQSYAAMKTAQYCKQHNPTGATDLLRLQSFSFPKDDFSKAEERAKEVGETLYNAIVNFKSAMAGARKWIEEKRGGLFIPSNFAEYETTLKTYLAQWREIFKEVSNISYSRREKACFNFYKIAGNKNEVINFVCNMLTSDYNAQKAILLS